MDSENSVSLFYDYVKSEGTVTVAQLCRFKDQKISEILLDANRVRTQRPMPTTPT